MMIDCTGAGCANGAPGQISDPLTFTVLNALEADFATALSNGVSPEQTFESARKELMESAALSISGLVAVFLAVWGATDVVRSGQKVFAMFISIDKEKGKGWSSML